MEALPQTDQNPARIIGSPSLSNRETGQDDVDALFNVARGVGEARLNAALPAIYDELREIAANYLRQERPNHTLQPTALVHESYLRLLGQHSVNWNNRLHFISVAARMMRRVLSNYATARKTVKRDSGGPLVELDAALEMSNSAKINVLRLEEALRELETMDARQARVVELRFYGGLTIDETAEVLGISSATVQREWVTARQWLHREIAGEM